MPDYTKKVTKEKTEVLHPGESFLGATYALPGGRFGRMVGMGVGGVAGAVVAEKKARDRAGEHGDALGAGLAARLPAGKDVVLAITDRRLLVFEFKKMKGTPGDLVAEYAIDEVASIEADRKKLMVDLLLTFSDGSVADYEVQKMAKPDSLVNAFESVK